MTGGIVGIFAHPDDEAFGMAGTLLRATRAGQAAALVCATRGEAGEIADPALATPATLGQVREGELRAAAAAVGVRDVSFLDYLDGHLAEANQDEAVERITRQIRRLRPAVVVTFAANGMYGHPDHIAIHQLTLAAVAAATDPVRYPRHMAEGLAPHQTAKVYYTAPSRERLAARRAEMAAAGQGDFMPGGNAATIPFEQMATPEAEITTRVVLTDAEIEAKRAALAAHATQMPPEGMFRSLPPEGLREFLGLETFTLAPPPISARAYPTPEDDLFAGL